ncbi:hypothetical protein Tco_1523481 [Tanacetum coccineum]
MARSGTDLKMAKLLSLKLYKVVGSSNGRVCFSHIRLDALTVLFNPWTTEVTKLPMAPLLPAKVSGLLTLNFDYDSYTNDYKVVIAIKKSWYESLVQVLSLKSNTWKLIGQFDYLFCHNKPGILCNGALHWYVFDYHFNAGTTSKKVTLSFNLSWEKFLVFLEPNDKRYDSSFTTFSILEDQLCIFSDDNVLPRDIWVMRSYNVQDSWELLSNDCEINASKFVPSLVSPLYVLIGRRSQLKNLMSIEVWSAEVPEGECPHVPTKRRKFVKADEEEKGGIEEFYRREVGETENLYLHGDGETARPNKIEIEDRGSHTIPLCAERG